MKTVKNEYESSTELCSGITNKCINYYQFINTLSWSYTTTEFFQPKPKLACNSQGTDELPENGTQLPKHVGAAKWDNKLIRIDAFVGFC
jgi:hypothetical protein